MSKIFGSVDIKLQKIKGQINIVIFIGAPLQLVNTSFASFSLRGTVQKEQMRKSEIILLVPVAVVMYIKLVNTHNS